MSEWQDFTFGDIAEFSYGTMPKQEKLGKGEYPTFSGYKYQYKYPEFNCDKDDLIVVARGVGGTGDVKIVREKCYLTNLSIKIKANNSILDNKFFYYSFAQETLRYLDSGSAQSQITINDLSKIVLNLPTVQEQKAIASVLSSLDDKIDLLHRQNTTLERMAETLFRQWFIEEAQEDWEECTLDDLITVKGGTTPSTKEPSFWNGDINWTSPRDLSNQQSVFMFDTERKITEKGLAQIGSGLLPVGTLLMSSRAPIGYLAISDIPVAINQGYIAIVCDKSVSNYFMYLWCKVNMEQIKNAGNGSTFEEISKSNFKELSTLKPSIQAITKFDETVEPIFAKIKTNQKQIHTLEKLRDNLLPKLMSGEVRVEHVGWAEV
ncbi:MAG: restriction endonuclease subunit S [Methylophilaceae bacterium]